MTDKAETDRVTGEIAQIVNWKSGKGYFLNLTGDKNDYYGFGTMNFAVGSNVTMDVREGSGNFADKVCITKMTAGKPKADEPPAKETNVSKSYDGDFKNSKAHYIDKQELIVQQCCLKAAAEVVKAGITQGFIKDFKNATELTLTMKDKFFCDIAEGENIRSEEEND